MTTTRARPQKVPRRRLGRHLALIALIATLGVLGPAAAGVAPRAGAVSTGDCINGRIIVKVQGKSITARCGTGYGPGYTSEMYDGRAHYFVIRASDGAISHIWQTCANCTTFSNWTSLGGAAVGAVSTATYTSGGGALTLSIWVVGTDYRIWDKDYNYNGSGAWSAWYPD
jgi:hypothetical protein